REEGPREIVLGTVPRTRKKRAFELSLGYRLGVSYAFRKREGFITQPLIPDFNGGFAWPIIVYLCKTCGLSCSTCSNPRSFGSRLRVLAKWMKTRPALPSKRRRKSVSR